MKSNLQRFLSNLLSARLRGLFESLDAL